MDSEEVQIWRKCLCLSFLLISTWQIFLTFRQISLVAFTDKVPEMLSSKMTQEDFDTYKNFAVIGLIGKVFDFLRSTVVTILRIIRGYPAWVWSITADYTHIIGNRVVCYTIVETILANWLTMVVINIALLMSKNVMILLAFDLLMGCVFLVSAILTYMLVISTKQFGPAVLVFIAVPINVLLLLYIVIMIQFVIPTFCHQLPPKVEATLSPTAATVNFPISKVCMIPESSSGQMGPNAAFIGIWGYKMIVITESLLTTVGLADSRSVLAHELGHWIRGHMFLLVVSNLIKTLASCFVLALCFDNSVLFGIFKFINADPPHPAIGVLVGLQFVVPVLSAVATGFSTMMAYFCEYEADHFAVDLGLGLGLKNALISLVAGLPRYPLVDSWFAAWFIGHPDVLHRVNRILRDIS